MRRYQPLRSVQRMRRSKGLSQQDLAELSGVSQYTITEIETGRREARPSTLRKLAKALDAEVADFFREPPSSGSSTTVREVNAELLEAAREAHDELSQYIAPWAERLAEKLERAIRKAEE